MTNILRHQNLSLYLDRIILYQLAILLNLVVDPEKALLCVKHPDHRIGPLNLYRLTSGCIQRSTNTHTHICIWYIYVQMANVNVVVQARPGDLGQQLQEQHGAQLQL